MDPATASPDPGVPTIHLPGRFYDGLPATEQIVVILALIAVVTTMAFAMLSTIGSVPV